MAHVNSYYDVRYMNNGCKRTQSVGEPRDRTGSTLFPSSRTPHRPSVQRIPWVHLLYHNCPRTLYTAGIRDTRTGKIFNFFNHFFTFINLIFIFFFYFCGLKLISVYPVKCAFCALNDFQFVMYTFEFEFTAENVRFAHLMIFVFQ